MPGVRAWSGTAPDGPWGLPLVRLLPVFYLNFCYFFLPFDCGLVFDFYRLDYLVFFP